MTLHREFLLLQRRQTALSQVNLEEVTTELPVISPSSMDALDTPQVLETLAQLDEIYRAPVALFYLQDCSYNEIAEIVGVRVGTIKSRVRRGLNQLHQLLAERKLKRPEP